MKVKTQAWKRKAISGILASIIFFSMMFTAGLGFVLFSFTSYNNYSKAQANALQLAQAKSAESLSLRSCDGTNNPLPSVAPWAPVICSVAAGDVGVWVQNVGGVPITLMGIWILDTTSKSIVSGFSPTVSPKTPSFPSTVSAGSVVTCSGSACVVDTGFNSPIAGHIYSVNFITGAGNQFSATYPPPPIPNALPSITLSPNSGQSGTTVTVTGANFAGTSTMTVKFDGVAVTTSPVSVTTNSAGGFSATFVVPSSTTGAHTVSASDSNGGSASAVFTVNAPTITLSPNGSPYGVAVTINVTGYGFTPSCTPLCTVTIKFDGVTQTSTSTNSKGVFTTTFGIGSSTSAGSHTVLASDTNGRSASAIYTVTSPSSITPSLTLIPTVGQVGTTVIANGANFLATHTITLTFDGSPLTTVPTPVVSTSTGSFSATFLAPNSVAGPHVVTATDGTNTVSAIFTVTAPSISLSPTLGLDGTTVTIVGSYFAGASTITIKIDGAAVSTTPPVVTTTSGGSFGSSPAVTFKIPDGDAAGVHTVTATDASSDTATAILTITSPTITLNPVSGNNGQTVTVTGGGYTASSAITIMWDGSTTGMPSCSSDATGTITAGCVLTTPPSAVQGAHVVSAADPHLNTASATFTINCNSSNNCVSSSALGLGFLSLDFNSFHAYQTQGGCIAGNSGCLLNYYKPGGVSGGTTFNVPNAPLGYGGQSGLSGVSSFTHMVFSANFTNVDPSGRNIVLDSHGLFFVYVLSGGGSNFRAVAWSIGVVNTANGDSGVSFPATGIALPNRQQVTLYFVVGAGSFSSVTFPVMVSGTFYLHGEMGAGCNTLNVGAGSAIGGQPPVLCSTPLGQNEPLVVVYANL